MKNKFRKKGNVDNVKFLKLMFRCQNIVLFWGVLEIKPGLCAL